jgi:hypothetical protein
MGHPPPQAEANEVVDSDEVVKLEPGMKLELDIKVDFKSQSSDWDGGGDMQIDQIGSQAGEVPITDAEKAKLLRILRLIEPADQQSLLKYGEFLGAALNCPEDPAPVPVPGSEQPLPVLLFGFHVIQTEGNLSLKLLVVTAPVKDWGKAWRAAVAKQQAGPGRVSDFLLSLTGPEGWRERVELQLNTHDLLTAPPDRLTDCWLLPFDSSEVHDVLALISELAHDPDLAVLN